MMVHESIHPQEGVKSHNVSVLLHHLVCPTKYRRAVLAEPVEATLRRICLDIENRYEITFLEIGAERDHVHFLIQSVPTLSPSRLAQIIKSLTAGELSRRLPQLKNDLWGSAFWSSGYFINTVGHHGNEEAIRRYVRLQGIESDYVAVHVHQLELF